jgi:hypothetical protein
MKVYIFLFFLLSLTLINSYSESTTIYVDVLNFTDIISIQVPSEINLSTVTKNNPVSDDIKITINNTGNIAVTITPELKSPDEIFENLVLQERKSGNLSTEYLIGNFSLDIDSPGTSGLEDEYFYMWLDLTDYTNKTQNLLDHSAEIVFYAVSQ